jgi:hypothetical protein
VKYMFLLFNEEPPGPPDPAALAAEMPKWEAFREEAVKVATEVSAAALQPSATATVVSVRDGKTITTDGPFVETKEQLGGFYVFDCENLDVALSVATKIPWAPTGHIEVRPVMEFD